MIIKKTITCVGIPSWQRDPDCWSDEMITMFVKRILRKTKSRRIIDVGYIIEGSYVGINNYDWIDFNVEVGKNIKMSAKDRKSQLKEMLIDESIIASL